MKPGATTRSAASITVAPPSVTRPISAILPPVMATSARRAGAPVPSTSIPFLITRSWVMESSSGDMSSLDDSIRSSQQRVRDRKAERFRGPSVDHELELLRPLDRQVGRLGAVQDLSDVGATAAESLTQIRSIRQQAAGFGELAKERHRRQALLAGEGGDASHLAVDGR